MKLYVYLFVEHSAHMLHTGQEAKQFILFHSCMFWDRLSEHYKPIAASTNVINMSNNSGRLIVLVF